MHVFRPVALAAALALSPGLACAATAGFSINGGITVTIDAPDATIGFAFANLLVEDFEDGTGDLEGSSTPDLSGAPFVPDPTDFALSGTVTGTASPTGLAAIFAFFDLGIDVANETAADISATVAWTLSADVSASVSAPGGAANAFAGVFMLFDAYFDDPDAPFVTEELEVFADALFGPPASADSLTGSRTFLIAPDDVLFVDVFAATDGIAAVVPLPASLAFGLLGLAGLGLLRARRG